MCKTRPSRRPSVRSGPTYSSAAGAPGGLPAGAAPETTVEADLPGAGRVPAVLDYRNPYFIGLRTGDTMYRSFGRHHFGATVGVSVHAFAPGAGPERITADLAAWLGRVYS
jgi:hypothetical protein